VVAWIAFGVALVVVMLVLGYSGYQVGWRVARLRADLAEGDRLGEVFTDARRWRERLKQQQP
jgi:hypothetical protein